MNKDYGSFLQSLTLQNGGILYFIEAAKRSC